MALLNYTTKIDADKTAAEIARCLSLHGASAVMTEYDKENGVVTALSFKITFGEQSMTFRLPCDWKPVYAVLEVQREKNRRIELSREQAVKVAWRIVKDWVEAQMALVETNMVSTGQVFLPYAVMKDGKTLAEKVVADPKFLLGDGNN